MIERLEHDCGIYPELPGNVSGIPILTPLSDRAVADLEDGCDIERDGDAIHGVHVNALNRDGVTRGHNCADLTPVEHPCRERVVLLELSARRIAPTTTGDRGTWSCQTKSSAINAVIASMSMVSP